MLRVCSRSDKLGLKNEILSNNFILCKAVFNIVKELVIVRGRAR